VQRWHGSQGMPVYHLGGCKGSVFAYSNEIDHWLKNLGDQTSDAEPGEDGALEGRRRKSHALNARALEMWQTRSEQNPNTIAGLYRKAIDQDPGDAEAFAGLANVMISAALEGTIDGSFAFPCAMEALRRTTQIDPNSDRTQLSTAWLALVYTRMWRQARSGFQAVLSRHPSNSFALSGIALLHVAEGNVAEALQFALDAWKQNALSSFLASLLCWVHYLAGDPEQTLDLIVQVKSTGGWGATMAAIESLSLIQAGCCAAHIDRIEANARDFPQSQTLQGALGHAYALSNQTAKAALISCNFERMSTMKKRSSAYGLALSMLGLGRENEAVPWLEEAFAEGALWSLGFGADPILNRLDSNPRFRSLLRKIGPAPGRGLRVVSSFDCVARAV
jgi:tetratricopeptide (TPR) repeat protein